MSDGKVSLTSRDFGLAVPRLNALRELRRKFLLLKAAVPRSLGKEFRTMRRYVSVPQNRSKDGGYKHGVWMGFAHRRFDDAHKGLQFQFGLWDKQVFTNGIWLEQGYPTTFARKLAWSAINTDRRRFTSLVARLGARYVIELWRRNDDTNFARVAGKFRARDIETLLDILSHTDSYLQIWKPVSKNEVVAVTDEIAKEIAETFMTLLPSYNFLMNNGVSPRKMRSIPSPEKILTSGMWAEEIVRKFEASKGRKVEVVSDEPVGYDIRSLSPSTGVVRYIEVKSRRIPGKLVLTPNEYAAARRFRHSYYVYVVHSKRNIEYVRNPLEVCVPRKRNQPVWELVNWKTATHRIH